MSEFSKEDYAPMLIQVHDANMTIDFLIQFDELRLHKEFSAPIPPELNRNHIIKYIALTYDKGSPYVKKYKDAMVRKVHTLEEAGFVKDIHNKYPEEVEELVSNENPNIVRMIVTYLKLHNNSAYSYLMVMESLYYGALADTLQQGITKKYTELQSTKDGYERAYSEFLAQDSGHILKNSLYKAMTADKLDLSPESIASHIKNNGIHATTQHLKDITDIGN